jgi:hypothetical protein
LAASPVVRLRLTEVTHGMTYGILRRRAVMCVGSSTVVVSEPRPTSKPDCINWLFR